VTRKPQGKRRGKRGGKGRRVVNPQENWKNGVAHAQTRDKRKGGNFASQIKDRNLRKPAGVQWAKKIRRKSHAKWGGKPNRRRGPLGLGKKASGWQMGEGRGFGRGGILERLPKTESVKKKGGSAHQLRRHRGG